MFAVLLDLCKTLEFSKSLERKYLLKVNRITRTRCNICSKLTMKIPEQGSLHCSNVFIVKCELVLHPALIFILLTLSR